MSELKSNQTSNSIFTSASLPIRILIYMSVAGAIVLPSYVSENDFVNHFMGHNKAEKAEARNNIGAINRAQQAYYLEDDRFADSIAELKLAIQLAIQIETPSHSYRIVQPMMPVQDLNPSVTPDPNLAIKMAIAQKKFKNNLKNYLGIVYTLSQTDASGKTEIVTRSIICEMPKQNPLPTTMPALINGYMKCPVGSTKVGE